MPDVTVQQGNDGAKGSLGSIASVQAQRGEGEQQHAAMTASEAAARPRLLLLSHCLPCPGEAADQQRAWQLLQLAARTHQVYAVALADRPTSLAQWRRPAEIAHRLVLDPLPWLDRVRAAMARRSNLRHAWRHRCARPARATAKGWALKHRFDLIVATHPGFWELARSIPARLRVTDIVRPAEARCFTGFLLGTFVRYGLTGCRQHRRALAMADCIRQSDMITVPGPEQQQIIRQWGRDAQVLGHLTSLVQPVLVHPDTTADDLFATTAVRRRDDDRRALAA